MIYIKLTLNCSLLFNYLLLTFLLFSLATTFLIHIVQERHIVYVVT